MTWFALQSLFLILGAFLVGLFTGWLAWGRQSQPERIVVLHEDGSPARSTTSTETTTPVTPVTASTPVVTQPSPQPEDADNDDLRRIEGVGPKVAEALQAEGIRRYADLAECDEHRLRDLLRAAGLRFSPTLPSWPAQAKLLAAGDDEGFEQLSAQVAAERRTAGTN